MRNNLTEELAVCGFNAVKALGEFHPEKINRLFLREDRFYHFTGVCKILAERKRPYKICDDEELERICKSSHHQGAVAMIYRPQVEELCGVDLENWAEQEKTAVLLCDLGNDHNLGAIVRSAAFFDAPAVILTNPGLLTTSAYRVAEGGMEHVGFRSIDSAPAFVRKASRTMVTIGTDLRARLRIGDLPDLIRDTKKRGVVLVLGNEETGLPQAVKDLCGMLVRIPGTGAVESLNVSQAAALFLHALYER
ncbi:MAG: RNA methyltransferase [Treponema sp.]|nr:RNA methyltransferase [Treponema sp.]